MAATLKCDTIVVDGGTPNNIVMDTSGNVTIGKGLNNGTWTTGTRPTPVAGMQGYNSTLGVVEFYNGLTSGWVSAGGGGGGSGTVSAGTAGQLAYYAANGTTVGGLTLGTGVQTALGNAVGASGGLVTYNGVMGTGPQIAGSGSGTLTLQAQSAASGTLTLPNGPGTLLSVTATLTQGSVVFAGASGVLSEDNANFFWDDTNNRLGLGTVTPATQLYVSKNAAGAISALGNQAAGTTTLDFSTSNNFSMTLTGNVTLANPSNLTAGQSGVIYITQDGTGNRTIAFGSSWKFPNAAAPSLSTAANAIDVLVYSVYTSTQIVAQLLPSIG
jgi:hypothetical protein